MSTRETVLAYLRANEAMDLSAVAALLHAEVELIEHPNKLNPTGMRADRAAMQAAGERGRAAMARQRYDVRGMVVEGNRAAVQIAWTGTLSAGSAAAGGAADGEAGGELHAQICSVIELRDGKIWRQEQYDCF